MQNLNQNKILCLVCVNVLFGVMTGCVNSGKSGAALPPEESALAISEEDADGNRSREGFQALLDAVVRIDVRETNIEGGAQRLLRGVGSGVIVSDEGHLLTNAHVVSPKAVEISVTLANLERVNAQLIGWDHWTDLAVLQLDMGKIRDRGLDFSVGQLGPDERPKPGQTVYAVGTPNGLMRTVTRGIISNAERFFAGSDTIDGHETGYFNTWLQTDAAINPGNSGGPLVLPDGRIVGINTRGYLGANNLAFSVPVDTARAVMDDLLSHGSIERSYIGLRPAPLQDLESFFKLEANEGVLVNSVDPGSPADGAGLLPGDIVLRIDGDNVDGRFPEQLPGILRGIARRPVGSLIVCQVRRGEEVVEVKMLTELLESRVGEQAAFEDWGFSVQKISRAVARERRLESADGVQILGVLHAFPADKAGLQAGDIITRVNREPLQSLDQLRELHARSKESGESIFLEILRFRQVSYKVLKP